MHMLNKLIIVNFRITLPGLLLVTFLCHPFFRELRAEYKVSPSPLKKEVV